ncbi:MAG: hypothetical protein WB562_00110 [Candidatus Sulfotelmatobacter sp.]
MTTPPNESLCFTALLVFLGMLVLYGGGRWLGLLIPAAILVCLVASARCHARRAAVDARVDNRAVRTVAK